jgi:uncharacterized Zn finger protein
MPRETALDKAGRLLSTGMVTVLQVDVEFISARVQGDTEGIHDVVYAAGRWWCDCSAFGACSHGIAVAKVTGGFRAGSKGFQEQERQARLGIPVG